MTGVSEVLKSTFDSARDRLVVLEKGVQRFEKKARSRLGVFQARFDKAPKQLEGAWNGLVEKVKPALVFVTRDELRALAQKVDELAARIDKLAQGRARKTNAS